MTQNELNKILENHKHWLNKDVNEWKNMYADLSDEDLRYADLRYADLRYANLIGANLNSANLRGANLNSAELRWANLRYANLNSADLSSANLRYANLIGANLNSVDLSDADLKGADLSNADLRYVNLRYANLRGANLNSADLSDADLRYVDLNSADLKDADLDKEEQIRKGVKLSNPITGWKKCKDGVIVKLEIPRGAIVFSINNHKCRTDKAIVKEIQGSDRAFSKHKYFSYYVGDKIEVYNFNCEYNTECAEGIHFFINRQEAVEYY